MRPTQLTPLHIYGSKHRLQLSQEVQSVAPSLYSQDFSIYTDSIQDRKSRNHQEITKLKSLIQKGTLRPEHLLFNASYCFYPSYILHHHLSAFTKIAQACAPAELTKQFSDLASIGAIFNETINVKFQREKRLPQLNLNRILMNPSKYFYSKNTSQHIQVCCFLASKGKETHVVFVRLRNADGYLCPGVVMTDLGSTISGDYVAVGYRFNNVEPIFTKPLQQVTNWQEIEAQTTTDELSYSLQDLMSSLKITVDYTSLRRQFSTQENTKEERRIIEYQAVSGRIVDGFSALLILSSLRSQMEANPSLANLLQPYSAAIDRIILPRLIELRECCGGYGYLQVSGHPALIERSLYSTADTFETKIPSNPEFFKLLKFNINPKSKKLYEHQFSKSQDLTSLFHFICAEMKERSSEMRKEVYIVEFLTQICIHLLGADPNTKDTELYTYTLLAYILNHAQFFNSVIKTEDSLKLLARKGELLLQVQAHIPSLLEAINAPKSPHIIQATDNFYEDVFSSAKTNFRNSDGFRKGVQKPLVDLIHQQKARL